MASKVTATPVSLPSGIRATVGKLDFNATAYVAGGLAVTPTQWGAALVGCDGRNPDFVFFNGGSAFDDADSDAAVVARYIKSTGKVALYGEEAITVEVGLLEADDGNATTTVEFLALWVSPDVATATV